MLKILVVDDSHSQLPEGITGKTHALFSVQDVISLTGAINSYNLENRELLSEMDVRKIG
jgi:hypothetical protein